MARRRKEEERIWGIDSSQAGREGREEVDMGGDGGRIRVGGQDGHERLVSDISIAMLASDTIRQRKRGVRNIWISESAPNTCH